MEYIRKINYYETDKMGIVHHSNYIRYFEEARIFLMENFDMNYSETEKAGILIPVLGVNAEYKLPLAFGDEIVIDARIRKFNGVKMTVTYKAYRRSDMQLSTVGETTHCFLDANTFKPLNIKQKAPQLYAEFLRLAEGLEE